MRAQLSNGEFPCRASLPRVDLLVYRRAGILIYPKESASRRPRCRRCMQKRRPRCMRQHRRTNKARYRRQMSKAKLGFASARVYMQVELRLEFHINFNAPESLAQSTIIPLEISSRRRIYAINKCLQTVSVYLSDAYIRLNKIKVYFSKHD